MGQHIYFFSSRTEIGKQAFDLLSILRPTHKWSHFTIETKEERQAFEIGVHHPNIVISFLNPYIIPKWLLEQVGTYAYNIHPASPDYPGRDPQHFAFYEGASVTGATLHRMDVKVDNGEILDVLEESVDRSKGVVLFLERSELLSLAILLKNLDGLLYGGLLPMKNRPWRSQAKRSRKDFLVMCEITLSMSPDEIRRRIDAFSHPGYRNLYITIQGYRFIYDQEYQDVTEC